MGPELFSFVGRYQLELEQMRKECRDQYSKVTSGTCPTCEKFIHVNLGKHVALYHLDLAQLWRCPVGWCPVWKGTSQDCVDHMRRAHDTFGEGGEPGQVVSALDSHSRTVAQHEQVVRVGNSHRHIPVQSHWDTIVSSVPRLRSVWIP